MRLEEIITEKKEPDGTYAGVYFSDHTVDAILAYCKKHKIPNPIARDKVHTTLLFSRKYLPKYEAAGVLDPPMEGTPTGFDVWQSKPSKDSPDPKPCLVLEFDCPALVKRHKELMKEHEAKYDFDEYKPHITFSYNIEELDVDSLPEFKEDLVMIEEYTKDLDLNWKKNNDA